VALLTNASVRTSVAEFVFKQSEQTSVEEAFRSSRGAGIELQWQNFLKEPLVGHGFGVYPEGWTISKPVMSSATNFGTR